MSCVAVHGLFCFQFVSFRPVPVSRNHSDTARETPACPVAVQRFADTGFPGGGDLSGGGVVFDANHPAAAGSAGTDRGVVRSFCARTRAGRPGVGCALPVVLGRVGVCF